MVDFSRQKLMSGLNAPDCVTIVGTGAVGCWTSLFVALAGVPKLRIYTLGKVKASDVLRFPFQPNDEDLPYSDCIRSTLISARPELEIEMRGKYEIGDDLIGPVVNAAASEMDDFDSKIYSKAKSEGLNYVTGFYSEHLVGVTNFHSEKHPRATLKSVPVWSGNASSVGMHVAQQIVFPREEAFEWAMDLRRPDVTIEGGLSAFRTTDPAR